MGAGDCHRTLRVHQQREDVATVHDTFPGLMGGNDLRIIRFDRAGIHDCALAFDVLRPLAEFDGDAQSLQPFGFGARLTIRTVDFDALFVQHLSKHAHTGSANADEMGRSQVVHAFIWRERRMDWVKDDGTGFTLVVRHDCSS